MAGAPVTGVAVTEVAVTAAMEAEAAAPTPAPGGAAVMPAASLLTIVNQWVDYWFRFCVGQLLGGLIHCVKVAGEGGGGVSLRFSMRFKCGFKEGLI